jgi:hypothetical protein
MPVYFFGRNGIFRGGLESDLGVAAPRRFHDFPKSAPVGIPATGPALIDFNCLHNGPTWVLPQIDWTIVRSDKRQTPKNLVIRPCGHVITSRRTFRTHIYVSISDSIRARYTTFPLFQCFLYPTRDLGLSELCLFSGMLCSKRVEEKCDVTLCVGLLSPRDDPSKSENEILRSDYFVP